MSTLKEFFSPALVERLAAEVGRAHPAFPRRAFARDARAGLDELELMARGKHIAGALARHLPPAYPDALDILLRSLGPPAEGDENLGNGMAPFFYLPHTVFVAERGLGHFDLSMRAQREITRRLSAEFCVREYIEADPERAFGYLRRWAEDGDPHVRRLVSEGTRLRLPWGRRVAWLDEHPERVLSLLALLKDDPSPMVRRSVANNLNDLGKAEPALLVKTCRAWLRGASPERRALVEHALRSAVKRGEAGALALLGYGGAVAVAVEDVRFEPRQVAIGGRVTISFALRSRSTRAQALLVDLAVHFAKAGGRTGRKVFKLDRVTLPARGSVRLETRVSLAVHTTRKPYPGRHRVEVLVNGRALPIGSFEVASRGR
jgi:3-methyladenine DNA glycosylase AlkC